MPADPHLSSVDKHGPSFRARRGICFFLFVCVAIQPATHAEPKRPKVLGIAGVTLLVSDLPESRENYKRLLQPGYACDWCEDAPSPNFELGSRQVISLQPTPSPTPNNLLYEVIFRTSDLKPMKKYLQAQHLKVEELAVGRSPLRLRTTDPEGHLISFVELNAERIDEIGPPNAARAASRIIHAGFIVRDRAAMEHFYKDILGFRPYWHGGMKDDQTDWISLQVPDGTDWVEFMVNVPENADQHLRGVMNHIALGVTDIHATREQLVKNGVHLTEEPKLGRDGKWQLNVYDPDQTRIEFMEFTPKEKPCCSEFTGPHPKP